MTQQFTSNHVTVSADGSGQFRRIPFRYAWPAEMDLMARIAGLDLVYRWADWDRSEFTAGAPNTSRCGGSPAVLGHEVVDGDWETADVVAPNPLREGEFRHISVSGRHAAPFTVTVHPEEAVHGQQEGAG